MKNVFVIHSYNGDTAKSFAPSIETLCQNNSIDYYFPQFPTRRDASYEGWELVLNDYRDRGLLTEESIVIAHSLGTQFIPKYLAKNNIKIKTYISVAGFIDYEGRKDLEEIAKCFAPTKEECTRCKALINNIYSIYSDNDEMSSVQKLELYAEALNAKKIFIRGGGHFNPKSKIIKIEEINRIILE